MPQLKNCSCFLNNLVLKQRQTVLVLLVGKKEEDKLKQTSIYQRTASICRIQQFWIFEWSVFSFSAMGEESVCFLLYSLTHVEVVWSIMYYLWTWPIMDTPLFLLVQKQFWVWVIEALSTRTNVLSLVPANKCRWLRTISLSHYLGDSPDLSALPLPLGPQLKTSWRCTLGRGLTLSLHVNLRSSAMLDCWSDHRILKYLRVSSSGVSEWQKLQVSLNADFLTLVIKSTVSTF